MTPNNFSEPSLHPDVAHRLKVAGFREDFEKASYDILIGQSHDAQHKQIRLLEELWHDDEGFARSAYLPTPSSIIKELPPAEYQFNAIDARLHEIPAEWRQHCLKIVLEHPVHLQTLQLDAMVEAVQDTGCNIYPLPSPSSTLPINPILELNPLDNGITRPIPTIPKPPPSTAFTPLQRTPRVRHLTGQPKRGHYGTKTGTIPPPIPSLPAHMGAISISLYQPVQRTSSKPTVLGVSQVTNRPTSVSGRWSSKHDSFAVDDDLDLEDAGYHWSHTDAVSYDHFFQGLYGCYALFEGTTGMFISPVIITCWVLTYFSHRRNGGMGSTLHDTGRHDRYVSIRLDIYLLSNTLSSAMALGWD